MAGKKRTPLAPNWYRADAYCAAESLDAGDWLLNLALRRWLHDEARPHTEAALRQAGPVLCRADRAQVMAMHAADCHRWVNQFRSEEWADHFGMRHAFEEACNRPSLPSDVWHALLHGVVKSGVSPLGVVALYTFERMLPEDVRTAGARFKPTDSLGGYPRAFSGTLDDAFGPSPAKQMTGRFVRIDLGLPDDVLHADLQRHLKTERRRMAAMGGPQPYREAAGLNVKAHDVRTLAADGLLQFLDIDRWQRAEGLGLSFHAVREMAGIDRSREKYLRRRVKLAQSQMQLHAWFARLERSLKIEPRPRSRKGESSQ